MNNKIVDNKDDYISISKVAYIIDTSIETLKRWYRWYESPEFEKPNDLVLPQYYFMDRRMTKYFKKSDLHMFKEFKAKLATTHWGIMADFNAAYQWGKRGKERCENQNKDFKTIKGRIK